MVHSGIGLTHINNFMSAIEVPIIHHKTLKNVDLLLKKVISKGMADKISNSGLCLAHLQLALNRAGHEGLKHLLSASTSTGKPRVTENSKVIEKLFEYLQEKLNDSVVM